MLSQECNWEQQIENALEAVKLNQSNGFTTEDPTTLIHRLQIKLKDNLKQLEDLENQYVTFEPFIQMFSSSVVILY